MKQKIGIMLIAVAVLLVAYVLISPTQSALRAEWDCFLTTFNHACFNPGFR
jgi:hypothetical protein